jgi:hypothetical protein
MGTWWLSFCSKINAKGSQFLGACLIDDVDDIDSATKRAIAIGINPGGEVLGVVADPETVKLIRSCWRNRLLSKKECEEMDKEVLFVQEEAGIPIPCAPDEHFICAEHNEEQLNRVN